MKVLNTPDFKFNLKQIDKIAKIFSQGGVVVYPTDTVYGIGCLVNNQRAKNKIYKIKNRERAKPFLILVSDLEMAQKYFEINSDQLKYLKQHWPGPISFLLKSKKSLNQNQDKGMVVRLPKNDFLTKLIERIACPITSTSLNLSGKQTLKEVDSLDSCFDTSQIDLVVNAGALTGKPSSIVDLRDFNNIKVIRN